MINMVNIEKVDTGAPVGGAYSPCLKVGNFVFLSGQIATDPKTGEMATTIEEQTIQVLNNIKALVIAAGTSVKNIVKIGVFLKNPSDFSSFNSTYQQWFGENGEGDRMPVRTTVGASFPRDDMLIEIDCIAVVDE